MPSKGDIIQLDYDSSRYFFPGEPICGRIRIEGPGPVLMELKGTQYSRKDQMVGGNPLPVLVCHEFLCLTQELNPVPQTSVHEPASMSFMFSLPEILLPHVCEHHVSDSSLRSEHLQLPPSLGNSNSSGFLTAKDMAPDMAQIRYTICASRLVCQNEGQATSCAPIAKPLQVFVLPRKFEAPPLISESLGRDFCMEDSVDCRKIKLLSGKTGRVTLSAWQPRSVSLPRPEYQQLSMVDGEFEEAHTPPTFAFLRLTFTPSTPASKPPELLSLSTKLRASTFWSICLRTSHPTQAEAAFSNDLKCYNETLTLPQRTLNGVPWTVSENNTSIAEIRMPISLPSHKIFLPSFNSCLLSRSYMLIFAVKVRLGKHNTKTVKVRVPLQMHADCT